MNRQNPQAQMPKWLLYGLIGKGILIALVIAGVVAYVALK